jgi:hypothetical protein
VPSLFRRKPTDLVDDQAETVTTAEPVAAPVAAPAAAPPPRSYTPKKGEATPKRQSAGRRVVEPAPTNRKEALARARQKQREARAEQRAGMMAGDDRYMLPRDKGPARALARDVVDARRNVATVFFFVLFLVLIGSVQAMPVAVQIGSNVLFLVMGLLVVVDSVLLCRRLKKLVVERFPKNTERWNSLYFYAVMRSLSFRRLRIPKPRVRPGQAI